MRIVIVMFSALFISPLFADVVHVYERTSAGGSVVQIADKTLETGRSYLTSAAPTKSGYIFTHWEISTTQEFEPRDAWGRAYDAAPYKLYETTTLTAHYLANSVDADSDGIADGYEYYWYGDLSKSASDDTDGDGYTFAEEIAKGFNPLFPERHDDGPVVYVDGAEWLYNPNGYAPYVLRSEPEGLLFETLTGYKRPGETIGTKETKGTYGTKETSFAYWSVNGTRQADAWGRALDSVTLAMPSNAIEIIAVCETDYNMRQSLYWYGNATTAMDSDTDGDGKTFAEEIAAGTNPLMPERHEAGPVTYVDGELWQYNPYNLQAYTIKSDPEGVLFETVSDYKRVGEALSSSVAYVASVACVSSSTFAYWEIDGVAQRDAWGRAVDDVSLRMPTNAITIVAKTESDYNARQSLYWYGNATTAMDSDTDGDGKTFAEELAAGTNPLMAERHEDGPVTYADTTQHELNLQVYEQITGFVIDGKYTTLSFEGEATPYITDINGDGLWDIVVVVNKSLSSLSSLVSLETNVWLNVGSLGNPEFKTADGGLIETALPRSLDMLAGLTLDVEPVGALSATTNGNVLLVSDTDGRIWYYLSTTTPNTYTLQHKVWGGSFDGFASGLMLAAVDWEDDGDLDCLCGTADGKLILLRNPKVGRPTNVAAFAGADNVLLTWDPNQQSRIRGYKVYRREGTQATEETQATDDGFVALVPQVAYVPYTTALPTYRDANLAAGDYSYAVSSVSRFYTAGNSTPTVSESMRTAAVTASVGQVKFFWNDVNCKLGDKAEVMLSIENSLNYDVAGKSQTVTFDPKYLDFVKVEKTGLTENLDITENCVGGQLTLTINSGVLAAGSGKFFTLVFNALKAGETTVGGATVTIEEETGDPTEVPRYSLGDIDGDGHLTEMDIRLLAKLKSAAGRKWSASQLKAGDFNGNGKLDDADYQALRKLLKEKGVIK